VIEPERIAATLRQSSPVKAVALVHAETSTGAWQPIEPISVLLSSAQRAVDRRCGHIAGRNPRRSRSVGHRCVLQRHAKMSQLPAWLGTVDVKRACPVPRQESPLPLSKLVS
jgi:hypothetical protein